MKRFSKLVLWVLLLELALSLAIGTRLRNQLERPATYLGILRSNPDQGLVSRDPPRTGIRLS